METDKTKKLSIMTKENYVSVTTPHTENDQAITPEELKMIERTLNGHTAQLTRAFMVAHDQGDFRRVKMAITNSNIEPPPLRSVRKDHKNLPATQTSFDPPSRPMGNGNNAPDSQMSWILATICNKSAVSLNNTHECLSTEELLNAIDQENGHPVHQQCCFSLDAVAMYPSLEPEETSSICAGEVVRSGVFFTAVNWEEMGLYLVLTGQSHGISQECLPTRKFANGPAPCITTAEAIGPIVRKKEESKFNPPVRLPNEEEKKDILFNVIKHGIYTVMTNHTYKWDRGYRLQRTGGPIGDKLACAAARLFMVWFDRKLGDLLVTAGVMPRVYKRYVDDGWFKATCVLQGHRFDPN